MQPRRGGHQELAQTRTSCLKDSTSLVGYSSASPLLFSESGALGNKFRQRSNDLDIICMGRDRSRRLL